MFSETKARNKQKLIKGIGTNDSPYVVSRSEGKTVHRCPYYAKWYGMIYRCKQNPEYTTCDEWKHFMSFKTWMEKQDWEGKELTLALFKTKHYSPENTCFLSRADNGAFADKGYQSKKKSNYPQGVSYVKSIKRFVVQCGTDGIPCTVGYFDNVTDATKAYKAFKYKHLLTIAARHEGTIRQGMLDYANAL